MTKISEYLEHLKAQGIDVQLRRLGTLWTLPELVDWDSKAEVIRFLGLRRQIAHCMTYDEDRLIDWTRCEVEQKKLKLHGRVRREDFELALGTLDGDHAAVTAWEDDMRERSYKRQIAALIGE
jgi:hypothetical protein